MKKWGVLAIVCLVMMNGAWLARDLVWGQAAAPAAAAPAAAKPAGFTMTKEQWEALLQKKIAASLVEPVTDDSILQGDNWHKAVYKVDQVRSVEFIIYTGPGQSVASRWIATPGSKQPAQSNSTATPGQEGPDSRPPATKQ